MGLKVTKRQLGVFEKPQGDIARQPFKVRKMRPFGKEVFRRHLIGPRRIAIAHFIPRQRAAAVGPCSGLTKGRSADRLRQHQILGAVAVALADAPFKAVGLQPRITGLAGGQRVDQGVYIAVQILQGDAGFGQRLVGITDQIEHLAGFGVFPLP